MNAKTKLSILSPIFTTLLLLSTLAAPPAELEREIPPPDQILKSLRADHPRIMAEPETFERLRKLVNKGGLPAEIYAEIKEQADKTLKKPVSIYEKKDGRRLLSVSREVMTRVQSLALVYHLEKDQRYADRAWKELEAAAAFQDWNPAHFLDTAEMTCAFALGYDWLYDCWTEEQRSTLCMAIVEKGLRPGLKVYSQKKGWHRNSNNWNQVCNGGLISGALAIADKEPEISAKIVCEALKSVPLAMEEYMPDGGGREGVTYWGYGSKYNVILMDSLETALGTDFGLSKVGGFKKSGFYQIYLSGVDRVSFNFADCGLRSVSAPQHMWMARKYSMPVFSWFRLWALKSGQPSHLNDLLWFDESGDNFDRNSLPTEIHFRKTECASMRSSWQPEALTVAIQAGNTMNLGGHRHLDLGSFILEALGERWIIDSGSERQTYMRHIHKNPRHFYYCLRAEGHNLPVLNPNDGPDQNPKATAKIVKFESNPKESVAVVDLSQAYSKDAKHAQRTFTLEERKRVVVTDELETNKTSELWWFLHTEAKVNLENDGHTARLTQNGKSLLVHLQKPSDASFQVMECKPLPTSPNPDLQKDMSKQSKLALHLTEVNKSTIQVSFDPVW